MPITIIATLRNAIAQRINAAAVEALKTPEVQNQFRVCFRRTDTGAEDVEIVDYR